MSDQFTLGGALDIPTLNSLPESLSAKLRRYLAESEDQLPPSGSTADSMTPFSTERQAKSMSDARDIRDLLVPQSPLDVGLMVAMGPGAKPLRIAGGALGAVLEDDEAEGAMGPGMAKKFFSPLMEYIRSLNVKKPISESQWREMIKPGQSVYKDPRTGITHPVSPDEWQFSMGDEVMRDLNAKSPGIVKDDLLAEIDKRYPNIERKDLGHLPPDGRDFDTWVKETYEDSDLLGTEDLVHAREMYDEDMANRATTARSHYETYTLPGKKREYQEALTEYRRNTDSLTEEEFNTLKELSRLARTGTMDRSSRLELDRLLDKRDNISQDFVPRARHFDGKPNILMHSRASRRQTPDGLPVRHVEEIQSDWHQQARDDGGYALTKTEREELDAIEASDPDKVTPEMRARFEQLAPRRYGDNVMAPRAPFRKNWHEVELKKQLAQAIDDGDELLTWSTGRQHADRYNLANYLDKLEYEHLPGGRVTLSGARKDDGGMRFVRDYNDDELEAAVGKDVAKRIMATRQYWNPEELTWDRSPESRTMRLIYQGEDRTKALARIPGISDDIDMKDYLTKNPIVKRNSGVLEGDDFQIGGHGMTQFYDRDIVDSAKKLARQYGGEYVPAKIKGSETSLPRFLEDEQYGKYWENGYTSDKAHNNFVEKVEGELFDLPEESGIHELLNKLGDARRIGTSEEYRRYLKLIKDEFLALSRGPDSEVHGIRITPAMREKFKAAGGKFSLYKDGGEVEMASGGRVGKEVIERIERWLKELGAVPAREMPEEGYQFIKDRAPEGSKPVYHGTQGKSFDLEDRPMFLTDKPGVAEGYANVGPGFKSLDDGLVVPFYLSDDEITKVVKGNKGLDALLPPRYRQADLNRRVTKAFENEDGTFKLEKINDIVGINSDVISRRSPQFLKETYGDRAKDWDGYLITKFLDQFYAKKPRSLRKVTDQ